MIAQRSSWKLLIQLPFPSLPFQSNVLHIHSIKKNCCVRTHLTKMKTVHLQSVGRSVRRSSTLFSIPISLHRAINLPSVCQIKAYWDWNLILQLVKLSSSATAEDHQHLIHYFVHLSGQLQHQLLLCKGTLAVRERNSGLVARSQNGHPCFSEFCLWFSEWLWTNP